MAEKIQGIGMVLIWSLLLFVGGSCGQISCHLSQSEDVSVYVKGIWRYWIGINGNEKIYLRPAFVQGLGILYFICGVCGVLLWGISVVKPLTIWVTLGGMGVGGIAQYRKTNPVLCSKHAY